jgi:putative serine protease PepD
MSRRRLSAGDAAPGTVSDVSDRRSLWTDRPDHWLSAQPEAPARPRRDPDPGPPPPPPRRRGRRVLTAGLLTLAATGVAGGAYVAGSESGGDDGSDVAALPASAGTLKPTDVGTIYARASEAVVSVQVRSGGQRGSGTGFLIDRDGTVVTNAHVVGGAGEVQVRLDDGAAPVAGRVVGTDASSDLAVVKLDASDVSGRTPLTFAESRGVRVGDATIAIGYPLGLDRTATAGIVSGLERQIEAPNGFSIDEVIQTDAPINPGNSGGPLLDARGRVIGVNSQIATAGGQGNVGIGFAVPSNTVREVVPQLKSGRRVRRPYLGVSTQPAPNGDGATVVDVTRNGPADEAGIRTGDRILEIDGEKVNDPTDVSDAIESREPGEEVEVKVGRAGVEEPVTVKLGVRPDRVP